VRIERSGAASRSPQCGHHRAVHGNTQLLQVRATRVELQQIVALLHMHPQAGKMNAQWGLEHQTKSVAR
jgi:hypothetical protein